MSRLEEVLSAEVWDWAQNAGSPHAKTISIHGQASIPGNAADLQLPASVEQIRVILAGLGVTAPRALPEGRGWIAELLPKELLPLVESPAVSYIDFYHGE